MFVCNDCLAANFTNWPSITQSLGKCEWCEKGNRVCSDIQSRYLNLKPKKKSPELHPLTREQWIHRYGGQELLDREGFDVVPCDPETCYDSICHGWRVVKKGTA